MNQFEVQRVRETARMTKNGRNQMTQGQRSVGEAIAHLIHNGILEIMLKDVAQREARILSLPVNATLVSDVWDETTPAEPKRVVTVSLLTGYTEQQATDPTTGELLWQDGDVLVTDINGVNPGEAGYIDTYEQVPVMEQVEVRQDEVRTLTYCAGKKFIYEDSTIAEPVLYLYQGPDSPSIKEFVEIMFGMFSFAAVTGKEAPETVQYLFGRLPADATTISALWDFWP